MHRVLSAGRSFIELKKIFKIFSRENFADHNFCETTFHAHQDSFLVYKKQVMTLNHGFSSKACVTPEANSRWEFVRR